MDKYISASKLKAKVISGEPVLFNEATQHEIFFLLELEPSEDVKPVVHAHWTHDDDPVVKCSRCGNFLDMWGVNGGRGDANFCPHCGAKMDEEGKDD